MCTLTSALTNTSQLAQRIPGQPGRHSTGCVHRMAGQEYIMLKMGFSNEQETCDCGTRQTMQHLLVCPMMDTACSPQGLATANGIAIGCAKHWEGTIDERTTPGGRTRMMMTIVMLSICYCIFTVQSFSLDNFQ